MAINRTRQRQSPTQSAPVIQALVRPTGGANFSLHSTLTGASGEWFSESISDEQGVKTSLARPCEHTTVRTNNYGYQADEIMVFPYIWKFTGPIGHNWSNHPDRSPSLQTRYGFNRRAIRSVRKHIPKVLSVPNFLLEIDDIPKLVMTTRELTKSGLKSYKDLRNAWLSGSFGLLPLLSDLTSALDVQRRVQKRLAHLRKTKGKPTKFRRSSSFSFKGSDLTWSTNSHAQGIPYQTLFTWSGKVQMKAGGAYTHELRIVDDIGTKVDTYLSALGFDDPLKVAWDAIPFSFLADYFLNVGDLLESTGDSDVFDGAFTLHECWSTYKVRTVSLYHVRYIETRDWGGYPYPTQSQVASECTLEYFSRSVGIPTELGLAFNTELSANQIANVIALVT